MDIKAGSMARRTSPRDLLWWLAAGLALCLCSACSCTSSQTPSKTENEKSFLLGSTVGSAFEGQDRIRFVARAGGREAEEEGEMTATGDPGGSVVDEEGVLRTPDPIAGTVAKEIGEMRAAEDPGAGVSLESDAGTTTRRKAGARTSPAGLVIGLVLCLCGSLWVGKTAHAHRESLPSSRYVVFPKRDVKYYHYLPGVGVAAVGAYFLARYFRALRKRKTKPTT